MFGCSPVLRESLLRSVDSLEQSRFDRHVMAPFSSQDGGTSPRCTEPLSEDLADGRDDDGVVVRNPFS
jgi:hypothetical protein